MERWTELALVAHEIGSALTPTRNAMQLLQDGRAGTLSEQQQHFVALAVRGIERAERILANLASIAAPEAYVSAPQEISPVTWFGAWITAPRLEAQSRQLRLDLDVDTNLAPFPVDAFALEQVLGNLLSNALKFTPAGGSVRVEVQSVRGAVLPGRMLLLAGTFGFAPRFVQIGVTDTGPGLSDETLRRLFQPFFRGPEASQAPGMGLGLTVAKRMIRLLHGDLRAERLGTGARFVVTLPGDIETQRLALAADELLDALRADLAAGRQNIVVLRRVQETSPSFADFQDNLQDLPLPLRTRELVPNTWVVWSANPMRALLRQIVDVLRAHGGSNTVNAFHARSLQASSGVGVDEMLLQLLVRCREPLVAQLFDKEMLHEDPRGR